MSTNDDMQLVCVIVLLFYHQTLNKCGPAIFLPISRIRCRCAIIDKTVKFEYGEDSVTILIAIRCELTIQSSHQKL